MSPFINSVILICSNPVPTASSQFLMDKGKGLFLDDSGPWNHDATIKGAQWLNESFYDKAENYLDFDGDDDYAQIVNDSACSSNSDDGDKAFSVSCWFKREGNKESYYQGLVTKYGYSRLDQECELYMRKQDDKPAFRLGDGAI
ncbi:MAG: hypothetical protein ACFFFH_10195 [Candidatus Thorarchaeota archaeon]